MSRKYNREVKNDIMQKLYQIYRTKKSNKGYNYIKNSMMSLEINLRKWPGKAEREISNIKSSKHIWSA